MAEQGDEESWAGASARFEQAVSQVEASVRALNQRLRARARDEAEVQKLVSDRARLATDLDKANAKTRRLDESAGEVSRRLVDAMETVRQVLAK